MTARARAALNENACFLIGALIGWAGATIVAVVEELARR